MVEWSITTVLKTVVPRGTGGSNPSLSANKGVNQQVMRFTPFITPKKFLGISCMVYCGTMSGILFLRIIQSYQNKTVINYYTIALVRNKTSHQRAGFSCPSTSLNITAGRWRPSTLTTRYATTRCICSSTMASLASNGSCRSSTAPTTPTLSLPSNRQE